MDDFGNDLGLSQSGAAIDAMARFILEGVNSELLTEHLLAAYQLI